MGSSSEGAGALARGPGAGEGEAVRNGAEASRGAGEDASAPGASAGGLLGSSMPGPGTLLESLASLPHEAN